MGNCVVEKHGGQYKKRLNLTVTNENTANVKEMWNYCEATPKKGMLAFIFIHLLNVIIEAFDNCVSSAHVWPFASQAAW